MFKEKFDGEFQLNKLVQCHPGELSTAYLQMNY